MAGKFCTNRLFSKKGTNGSAIGGFTPGRMTLSYDLAAERTHSGRQTSALPTQMDQPRPCQSILVPLDGTPFAEHALPRALALARRSGGRVRLVHVAAPAEAVDPGNWSAASSSFAGWLRNGKSNYLDEVRRRIHRASPVGVDVDIIESDDRIEALSTAAASSDLILIATHARGPLARLFRGSVADTLIRQVTSPVLLVRGYNAPVDLTGDPVARHILVPLDGRTSSEQVLDPALDIGMLTGAQFTLLRIVRKVSDFYPGRSGSGMVLSGETASPRAVGAYPLRLVKRLRRQGVDARPRILSDDRPAARVILRCAASVEADLIALTTDGHRGWSRFLPGSITDQVIRRATVPVLVCRSLPPPARFSP